MKTRFNPTRTRRVWIVAVKDPVGMLLDCVSVTTDPLVIDMDAHKLSVQLASGINSTRVVEHELGSSVWIWSWPGLPRGTSSVWLPPWESLPAPDDRWAGILAASATRAAHFWS